MRQCCVRTSAKLGSAPPASKQRSWSVAPGQPAEFCGLAGTNGGRVSPLTRRAATFGGPSQQHRLRPKRGLCLHCRLAVRQRSVHRRSLLEMAGTDHSRLLPVQRIVMAAFIRPKIVLGSSPKIIHCAMASGKHLGTHPCGLCRPVKRFRTPAFSISTVRGGP